MDAIWPEVFTNPDYIYPDDLNERQRTGMALADGLSAWGLTMMKEKPPLDFGQAMLKVSDVTGAMTPDQFSAAAKKWHEGPEERSKGS